MADRDNRAARQTDRFHSINIPPYCGYLGLIPIGIGLSLLWYPNTAFEVLFGPNFQLHQTTPTLCRPLIRIIGLQDIALGLATFGSAFAPWWSSVLSSWTLLGIGNAIITWLATGDLAWWHWGWFPLSLGTLSLFWFWIS